MKTQQNKFIFVSFVFLFFLFVGNALAEFPAVASLKKINGNVQVLLNETGKMMIGREGQLLKSGDQVITSNSTTASIIFRDGSEVRIFENTRFIIQEATEESSKNRSFKYNFMLKIGTVWGRFMQSK